MEYSRKLSLVQNRVICGTLVVVLAIVCFDSPGRVAGSQPDRYAGKNLFSSKRSKLMDWQSETLDKEKELRKALQQL